MPAKIQNYIFDFGKVLVRFDPDYMTDAYVDDPVAAAQITPVVFDRLYWDPLDRGTITDEALKAACHKRLPPELHDLADRVYDNWIHQLPFIEGMFSLVQDIKAAGCKLFLLSNISIGFAQQWQQIPQIAQLFSLFDGLVFSGPLGITKPHREIFEHLLHTYGLQADTCLFIDDSPINVAGAEAAGIAAYLFDGDAGKLRAALNL